MHLRSSIHAYHFNHISIWDCKERESSWVMKLDKVRAEEQELRERDWWNRKRECLHQRKSVACRQKTGSGRRIKELELEVDSYRMRAKLAEFSTWKTMCECYGVKKKAPKDVSYLPPLCHASPPLCHCASPNPKQSLTLKSCHWPNGRWLLIPPKNPTHFPPYLRAHSNLDINYTLLYPSSQVHNYSMILLHTFREIQYP